MKKLLIFILLTLPLVSMADHNRNGYFATINIHTNITCSYEVYVNGVFYDLRNNLSIFDLHPGEHHIKVVAHSVNRRGYGRVQVVYNNVVFLPHGSVLNACINRFGDFVINEIVQPRQRVCARSCHLRHQHAYAPQRPLRSARAYRGNACRRW